MGQGRVLALLAIIAINIILAAVVLMLILNNEQKRVKDIIEEIISDAIMICRN